MTETLKDLIDNILNDPLMEPWKDDPDVRCYIARQVYLSLLKLMIEHHLKES